MLSRIKPVFHTLLAAGGFLAVMLTGLQLILFLSYLPMSQKQIPSTRPVNIRGGPHEQDESGAIIESWYSGIVNVLLLSFFTLQHSAMANPSFKQCISQWGFGTAERSLYIIATCSSLLVLFYNWHLIPWYLWQFENKWVSYMCIFVHSLSWILIYGGSLQMDFSEMIGIKQVYYELRGLPDPMSLKTSNARRLLGHMRHPSFIGFCVLFWFNPYMSADRFLLAVLLTLYMLCAWNVDAMDHHYHKEQLTLKKRDLSR